MYLDVKQSEMMPLILILLSKWLQPLKRVTNIQLKVECVITIPPLHGVIHTSMGSIFYL